MRRHDSAALPLPAEGRAGAARPRRNEWHAFGLLLPYLWEFKGRVLVALVFLAGA